MSHISNIVQKKKGRRFACLKITAIIFALVLFSFPVIAYDKIYDMTLSLTKWDEVNVTYAKVTDGYLSTFSTLEQPYRIALSSATGKELYSNYLYVGFTVLTSPPLDIEMNSTTLFLRIPYKEDAKAIKLLHNNKEIFSFDTSLFCTKDSVCGLYENEVSCPEDCALGKKDGYCNAEKNSICDPDCLDNADPDCNAVIPPALENKTEPEKKACGDGVCGTQESYLTCPSDCKSSIKPETKPASSGGIFKWILFSVLIVLAVVILVIIFFKVRKPKNDA